MQKIPKNIPEDVREDLLGEVFKVQVSLTTSHAERQVLIYNKSKEIMIQLPATKAVLKVMGGRPKVYFHGYIENKNFHFNGEAKQQDW